MADAPPIAENAVNEAVLRHRETPEERATAQANRQTLIDAVLAFGGGNGDAFWAIFHDDVVFHEAPCLPYGGAHAGLEATQRAYASLQSSFAKLDAEFEAVLAARDLVLLYQTVTFTTHDRGTIGRFPVVETFRFRDGKVIEWRANYFDSNLVAEALRPIG